MGLTSSQISSTGVALGAAFVAYGISLGEAGEIWKAAGIGSAALTLFATRAVPEIVTAFGIFLSALALGIIPREVVFSGFMSSGFWLLVSGIILGVAIAATGLAARDLGNRGCGDGAWRADPFHHAPDHRDDPDCRSSCGPSGSFG